MQLFPEDQCAKQKGPSDAMRSVSTLAERDPLLGHPEHSQLRQEGLINDTRDRERDESSMRHVSLSKMVAGSWEGNYGASADRAEGIPQSLANEACTGRNVRKESQLDTASLVQDPFYCDEELSLRELKAMNTCPWTNGAGLGGWEGNGGALADRAEGVTPSPANEYYSSPKSLEQQYLSDIEPLNPDEWDRWTKGGGSPLST